MADKIDHTKTIDRIHKRLVDSGSLKGNVFYNLFALDQGIRMLRDDDKHLSAMMRAYGQRYIGRYDHRCPKDWLRDDINYMALRQVHR